jgi:hypothetical protein
MLFVFTPAGQDAYSELLNSRYTYDMYVKYTDSDCLKIVITQGCFRCICAASDFFALGLVYMAGHL